MPWPLFPQERDLAPVVLGRQAPQQVWMGADNLAPMGFDP